MYPTGILINKKTGRFHPIPFRPRPLPSERPYDGSIPCRHKSIGHHTEGFATIEAAKKHIEDSPVMVDSGCVWEWDGKDIPAMTCWF